MTPRYPQAAPSSGFGGFSTRTLSAAYGDQDDDVEKNCNRHKRGGLGGHEFVDLRESASGISAHSKLDVFRLNNSPVCVVPQILAANPRMKIESKNLYHARIRLNRFDSRIRNEPRTELAHSQKAFTFARSSVPNFTRKAGTKDTFGAFWGKPKHSGC
jgi:hypothetical protein